jgi:hypothetical protein
VLFWQNELLKDVGFERRTYLPSTFAKQEVNKGKNPDDVATLLCSGTHLCSIIVSLFIGQYICVYEKKAQ